jgi:hypothetical protein
VILLRAALAAAFAVSAGGCGYHVGGKADMMPKTVHTVAVPAWGNATTRYRLTDKLPTEITKEFVARTRYQVVNDPGQADAVLNGTIVNYFAYPIIFDQATGRATTVQVIVYMSATLVERGTGKVLWARPNFEWKQQYEIATDARAFFDESDVAMDRLSRDVARMLVSAILENF